MEKSAAPAGADAHNYTTTALKRTPPPWSAAVIKGSWVQEEDSSAPWLAAQEERLISLRNQNTPTHHILGVCYINFLRFLLEMNGLVKY